MTVFALGMVVFATWLVPLNDVSSHRALRLLRWYGAALAAAAVVGGVRAAANWPRRDDRPFRTGVAVGVVTAAGLLAGWAFVG